MTNRYLFSGFLVLCVAGLVFYYRHTVIETLNGVRIGWTITGFCCVLINYFFRSWRLNVLTEKKLPVWPQGIYCTSMHGFANYMLPMRSGDISLPLLLKSTSMMNLKDGTEVLYRARLLEVFTLGIWLVAAGIAPNSKLALSIRVTMFLLGLLMILTPFLLKQFFKLSFLPFKKIMLIVRKFTESGKMNLKEIILTFGIWASIAACTACIAAAIQLPISPADIVLLIAVQLSMQLMPVQGFANSGNHEGGWVAALMMMGCSGNSALKFAFTSHAIMLVYVIVIGLITLIIRHTCKIFSSDDRVRT